MKNRDLSQIECLGRQIFGKADSKKFVEVYKKVVSGQSYPYLLVDLASNTPDELRLRSAVTDEEPCEKVYKW